MPASITLKSLSYSTPDDSVLLDRLDLIFGPRRTGLIGRNGTGKSTLLKLITGALSPSEGEVVVNGSTGMLHQTVQVDHDRTVADLFGITADLARLDRLENGTASLADAGDADWTLPSRLEATLAEIGLPALPSDRPLTTLSGGQRTLVALGALIFSAPDILLLDEPTNNLDAKARATVAKVLANWRGGAIVVSHDRALLRQMDSIVELTTLGATTYGGNWDHYRERKAIELTAAEHDLAVAERNVVAIDRKIQAGKERKARKDSAGNRKRARGDMPKILLDARKNTAEKTSGDAAHLARRQRAEAAGDAAEARAQIEILKPLTVQIGSTGLRAGRIVLRCDHLTGGPLPDSPIVRDFSLTIAGPERVAVTGPNGSGKTTLLRLLTGALLPVSGSVRIFGSYAMLDQTVNLLDPTLSIRDNFRLLNPDDDENACRTALARFMFRADAALQRVGDLSGGEMLRAGLAAVIGGNRPRELLILDEPTNHLDIAAIEAIEGGLRAYDGALLVISHDRTFLEAIGIEREITL